MTADTRKKIEYEAKRRFAHSETDNDESDKMLLAMFPDAATYGYSLAEQEIKEFQKDLENHSDALLASAREITRLKGLIEKQFLFSLRGWGNEDQREQVLQEFKTENNL